MRLGDGLALQGGDCTLRMAVILGSIIAKVCAAVAVPVTTDLYATLRSPLLRLRGLHHSVRRTITEDVALVPAAHERLSFMRVRTHMYSRQRCTGVDSGAALVGVPDQAMHAQLLRCDVDLHAHSAR